MNVLDYESVKTAFEGLKQGSIKNVKIALGQYQVHTAMNPDELIAESRNDAEAAQKRMDSFYQWLLQKPVKESTAHFRTYNVVKSFYTANRVIPDKRWLRRIPRFPKMRTAIKSDSNFEFFKYDENRKEIYFDRELMQRFLSNLKLRDQAITLALLSSSQDTGNLFELNVGDLRRQSGNRIFWESSRGKTRILFKTFFSKEASLVVRRYLEQERKGARDDEPLFVVVGNHGKMVRMTPGHLSSVFRDTAKKIGITYEEDEQNPLRPKRLRHLFRTVCDTAGVNELYINCFMGHSNSQGQDYSEVSRAKLEMEYVRVEPFLTVYGNVEEELKTKEEISKLQTTIDTLTDKIEAMRGRTQYFEELLDKAIKRIESLEAEIRAEKSIQKGYDDYHRRQDESIKKA